jgi:3-oxoacyl-[acyl-carrier-protein] synthase-3
MSMQIHDTSTMSLACRILGTGSELPGRLHSTIELATRAYPEREPEQLVARTGIRTRWWADPADTRASVSAIALRRALDDAGLDAHALARIIFVDSIGGDERMPNTANAIAATLGLRGSCDCVDLNNACTGFLSALDWAARSVATGLGPVAICTTELWSQALDVSQPRSYAVFGDAGTAVILGRGTGHSGLLGSWLRNDGVLRGSVNLRHRGRVDAPEFVRFCVSNQQIGDEASAALLSAIAAVLDATKLTIDEVDWVLPHQPNGRMLDDIIGRLGVAPERTVPIVEEVGSVGAASIPLSLDRLRRSARVRPGDIILFAAVGAGIGYGAALYREVSA